MNDETRGSNHERGPNLKNPSNWAERAPAAALAFLGFGIATYLALNQVGVIRHVWEPLFGNGSLLVLHSSLSRLLPVPDAALGAFGYLVEGITALIGGNERWRALPWMTVIFGLVALGMACVSVALIICQPLVAHAWCTLCLCSACISFLIVGPALTELRAGVFTLRARSGSGRGFWRAMRRAKMKRDEAHAS
jgi:uncharacterized membrane protein